MSNTNENTKNCKCKNWNKITDVEINKLKLNLETLEAGFFFKESGIKKC